MDRISSLPDGVIIHILSFLPIKKAATTSVLSKKWRILFTFSPNLDFYYYSEAKPEMDFVDRVLSVSGNSPIKKFGLSYGQGSEPTHFNRWLCNVLNRGVLELDLAGVFDTDLRDEYPLPFEIFSCKTLVKLELCGFSINELRQDAFLPALKALILRDVHFCSLKVCVFQKLLSASPVLEELHIEYLNWEEWDWSRTISSPSLQRLIINREHFGDFDGPDLGSITFDTPSLTYLNYCDFIPGSYPVVNLGSLVEANLDLTLPEDNTWGSGFADEDDNITSNPTNLITGLRNVEVMKLSSNESLEMFYLFRKAIPVFENLIHLSITPSSRDSWRGLPFLLNKSPNLETLIIEVQDPLDGEEWGYGSSGYSCLRSCPLRVLKITKYYGTIGEVKLLKHFLGKLPCLELLKVNILGRIDKKFQITKVLLMLPRASSKCKIMVK